VFVLQGNVATKLSYGGKLGIRFSKEVLRIGISSCTYHCWRCN